MIPSTVSQPALYPAVPERVQFKPVSDDDRLVYFAKYSGSSLGQVKNLYLSWARTTGPTSQACQELNRLFSQCVDGNRIMIPDRLKKVPSPAADSMPFILDDLHDRARAAIQNSDQVRSWDGFDFDAVELLSVHESVAMSEFEMIKLAFQWCRRNAVPFAALTHLFDFNILTASEKAWTINELPVTMKTPKLISNALCSSQLVSFSEISSLQLGYSGMRWKRIFDSSKDRMASFLSSASKAIGLFHKKLILFRPDERITIAVFIPRKVECATEGVVDDSVRVFAFPHHKTKGTVGRLILPTKINYRLYTDDNAFQLFEGQRANTWIYLARPGSDDSAYRNTNDIGDRRRQRQATIDSGVNFDIRASVALDKFSKQIQTYVGRVNRAPVSA